MTEPTGMRAASTSLPQELYDQVEELARTNDRTVSAQIRRMIKDWMAHTEMNSQPEPARFAPDPDGRSVTRVPGDDPHRTYGGPEWPPRH